MLRTTITLLMLWPLLSYGQWIQQGIDINGASEFDQSGWAVSLNAEGDILAVGARNNDDNGSASGQARIYQWQFDTWAQIGQAINGVDVSDKFGSSISISADGDVVAIGAPDNNSNGFEAGHVRVYRLEADTWEQIGGEIVGSAWGDHSGHAISLSDDGMRLAIGAPDAIIVEDEGSNHGQVRVFENQSDQWVQIGAEMIGEHPEDNSGFSVSLNGDGTVVAIGAPVNGDTGVSSGHVRVYQEVEGQWSKIGDDIDGGQEFYKSGSAVALNDEGNVLAIGAIDSNNSGSARVYENQSNAWVQIGSDLVGENLLDDFGHAISINSVGNIIAVGAIFNNGTASDAGHVRVFQNQSGAWLQVGADIDGEAFDDRSGYSVSLNAAGDVVASGSHLNDGNGTSSGHVRVYEYMEVIGIEEEQDDANFSIYPNPNNGRFIVQSNDQSQISIVEVFNVTGRMIESNLSTVQNQINDASFGILLNIPNGLYLLRLTLADGSVENIRFNIVR